MMIVLGFLTRMRLGATEDRIFLLEDAVQKAHRLFEETEEDAVWSTTGLAKNATGFREAIWVCLLCSCF